MISRGLMTAILSNRYVDALIKTLFLFALSHWLLLTVIAFRESFHVLNAFTILNIDKFLPALGQGIVSFILSYGMVLGVYGLVFLFLTGQNKKSKQIENMEQRIEDRGKDNSPSHPGTRLDSTLSR